MISIVDLNTYKDLLIKAAYTIKFVESKFEEDQTDAWKYSDDIVNELYYIASDLKTTIGNIDDVINDRTGVVAS